MPVTSFPAEYLELFKQAADRTVSIALPDEKAAHRMRARLNSLRARMREENHPLTGVAETVQFVTESNVEVSEGSTIGIVTWFLIAGPTDDMFVKALFNAGITVVEPADTKAPRPETSTPQGPFAAQPIDEDNFNPTEAEDVLDNYCESQTVVAVEPDKASKK